MRQLLALLAISLVPSMAACSSIRSTVLVQQADGSLKKGPTVDGVPTIVVETVAVAYKVTQKYYSFPNGKRQAFPTGIDTDHPIYLQRQHVVAVDVVRPISGTAQNSIQLEGQYPTNISTNVNDTTLQQATDSADKILERLSAMGMQFDQGESSGGTEVGDAPPYFEIYDMKSGTFYRQDFV